MQLTKHISTASIIFLSAFSGNVYGRPLYAITTCYIPPIEYSTLTAYDIAGEQIEYRTDTQIDYYAIGLALDPHSNTLFVTYDVSHKIVLVDAKTMTDINSIDLSIELAGIVYDKYRQKVYAVSREDDLLYVYLWNPILKSLTPETYLTLQNISEDYGSYGLALDEENGILYVTDKTDTVKYYDTTNNFTYKGIIDVNETAVGIDFYQDGQGNKYLYTGRYSHTSGDHYFLVRTNINDVNNPVSQIKNVGNYVSGVAADQQTGLIYITTQGDTIEVYNNATFPTEPCDVISNDISGPAGIVVCQPSFYFEKVDVNEPNCVISNDYITYSISYGNPVNDPCDPNYIGNINDVVITDYLPDYLTFIYASDPNMTYDPYAHTVTWQIGPLVAGAPNDSVMLTVKVNECIAECGIITNSCRIEGKVKSYNRILNWAYENTFVCSASNPNPACGEIVDWDIGKFNLTWCPGLFAANVYGHEVYFGSNFDDVYDANNSDPNVYKGPVNNPSYQIEFNSLDMDTTYYWRIDEVNEPNLWRGGVWSFKTGDSLSLRK